MSSVHPVPPPPAQGPTSPQFTVTIGRGFWRNIFKWSFGLLLVLALTSLLVAISLAHLTAEGPAKRVLDRSVASLTEIDTLLDQGYEELRATAEEDEEAAMERDSPACPTDASDRAAAEKDEEAALQLPDFPVQVTLSSEEVLLSKIV